MILCENRNVSFYLTHSSALVIAGTLAVLALLLALAFPISVKPALILSPFSVHVKVHVPGDAALGKLES